MQKIISLLFCRSNSHPERAGDCIRSARHSLNPVYAGGVFAAFPAGGSWLLPLVRMTDSKVTTASAPPGGGGRQETGAYGYGKRSEKELFKFSLSQDEARARPWSV